MNATAKQVLAAAALAFTIAGPASALTTSSLQNDVQSAISGSGNVNITVRNRVATLTGNVDSLSKLAVERAALASPDVDRVINLVQQKG